MEHRNNNRYVDVIEDLLEGYNNTPHSRHGGVPASIGDKGDMQRLWRQKFERETPKTLQPTLKVGDHVRMVGPRRVFAHEYHERWTRELFVVTKFELLAPIMLQKSREGSGSCSYDQNFSCAGNRRCLYPVWSLDSTFVETSPTLFLNEASAAVAGCKIQIHSAELKVRRCKVDPEVYSDLLTASARSATGEDGDGDGQYKYQHNQLECSKHTLGTGSTSYTITLPNHQKPNKVLVVLIDHSAHTGTTQKQVTQFAYLNITYASLKLDGVPTDK